MGLASRGHGRLFRWSIMCLFALFSITIHARPHGSNSTMKNVGLLASMVTSGAEGDVLSGISRKSLREKKQHHTTAPVHPSPTTETTPPAPVSEKESAAVAPAQPTTTTAAAATTTTTTTTTTTSITTSSRIMVDTNDSFITGKTLEDEPPLLFYMYELHEKFWWRWPHNGTEKECTDNGYLSHAHAEYSAIGRPIVPEDGLFLTWHFSMFNSLYNRFKRSRRRTRDPAKASMFIIPYDLGLDGYMNPRNCANRRSCTEGLVGKLMETLNSQPYFARHRGADHVVLWSLGQYHPWPRAGCDVFMRTTCELCTLSCYWMDPTKAQNRFVSMPFPAAYHYWDGIQRLPWDPHRAAERNLTAVYLGSTLTLNPWHTKIRRAMAAQCNESVDCHWLKIAHSSIDNTIGELLSVYKKATFCLCPPGDDPARKAVFDAIVSGCIPVVFEVATLYNQYPWHIGEDAALDISVYIPGGALRSGKLRFMDVLRQIPPDVIRKKQWALAQVAPRIQYAIPPYELLVDKYDETPWDPPFHDAAEVALDGFFQRTQRMLRNESTHIPHRLMTGREWGADYDSVRVQIPGQFVFFGEEINALPLSERHKFKDAVVPRGKPRPGAEGAAGTAETSAAAEEETTKGFIDAAVAGPTAVRRPHGKRGHHHNAAANGHHHSSNNGGGGGGGDGSVEGGGGAGGAKRRHHANGGGGGHGGGGHAAEHPSPAT